ARDASPRAVLRGEQLSGEPAQLVRPSLQLVDVRHSAEPLLGSSRRVGDRPPPSDKPAVSPIRRADAAFFREALAARRRALSRRQNALLVTGVQRLRPTEPRRRLGRQPGVLVKPRAQVVAATL